MSNIIYAGIDVGSEELVVVTREEDRNSSPAVFPNNPSGHKRICRRITKAGFVTRVCVEATGIYTLDLAFALHSHPGIEVTVLNPKLSRRFSEASGKRGKDDKVDAASLADFSRRMDFRPWEPPSEAALEARMITRRVYSLTKARTKEKERLHAAEFSSFTPKVVIDSIRENIEFLDRQIRELTDAARKILETDDQLRRKLELLESVKGIAGKSSVMILSELAAMPGCVSPKQWVAYAGLDPVEETSGKSVYVKKGISKRGNKYLREALFMPAIVASQYQPGVRNFKQSLVKRGKPKKLANVAVMRKLLHSTWGMFQHNQQFDDEKFHKTLRENAHAA
jgi:transposase